jgi:hypothetical protein
MPKNYVEIRKQNFLEGAEGHELQPELKKRTVAVLNTTKGLGFIKIGGCVFEDTVSNKQLAAKSRLGIKNGLAFFEQIRQKSRRPLSHQISEFGFFMIQANHLQFKGKCLLLKLLLLCQIS